MRSTTVRKAASRLAAVLLILLPGGCAKSPSGSSSGAGPQLIVTMTVAGRINPNYFYFVLFNNAGDLNGTNGPIPVVTAPYGNGFAAGALTQFLRYDKSQPNTGYEMYAVVPGSGLRTFTPLGAPVQYTPVPTDASGQPVGNTLQFRIPLSQLATAAVPAAAINALQINFLTTDVIPADPNLVVRKDFDALGSALQSGGINNYITISTLQSHIFQNSNSVTPEGPGDVAYFDPNTSTYKNDPDPDLDIIDWTIEVRD